MLRLDGGKHGVNPTSLAVALILDGRHAVQHFVGEMLWLLLGTAYAEQKYERYHHETFHNWRQR